MGYVYILSSRKGGPLYIGVTSDLRRRIHEHKTGLLPGFTSRYHLYRLVYYEGFTDIKEAIVREKQLKHWRRAKKEFLIESGNPEWNDLAESWYR